MDLKTICELPGISGREEPVRKAIYDECPKGLKEGWIQLHYKFDYSHAWGGTPMYQLPARISGLEILEPGMKKIRFN